MLKRQQTSVIHIPNMNNISYKSSLKLKFKFKLLFEPFFGGLRGNLGNVRTPPIARWKAHGRLPIRHNWTFFAISYGSYITSGNLSKSAFFERGGHFECKFQTEGVWHQTTVGVRKLEWLPFCVGSKYPHSTVHCLVLSQTTHVRQTDGQNYDS